MMWGRHISRLPDFNSKTRSFCLHYPTESCKDINSLGGEVASAFFFLHVITVAKMTSGKFKAEGNAIEVDNDSNFNRHKHYSVGSRTIGSRLYQFCLLDVLWESSSALAYTPQVSFLTSKISWC